MFTRRSMLQVAGLGGAALSVPSLAFAAIESERRLVFIIQRGAADGLGTIIPVGDPNLAALRGVLSVEGAQKLDSMFALHPALVETGKLFGSGQALFVHAVASPYRDRSHFDAQNVLEGGGSRPYSQKTGWINRLTSLLPASGSAPVAISPTIPAAMRGPADVTSYAPSTLPEASSDLVSRIGKLYEDDQILSSLWGQALATRSMAGDTGNARDAATLGSLAAKLLTGSKGARIAMVETTGWDTHSVQKARLGSQLGNLDALIGALKTGLGVDWDKTLVIVATEFGRTAAANGTGGTDHGTASAAMLLGGAVQGGRVMADWPGLAQSALYEGRDLRPTLSLDQLIADAVSSHFGLDPEKAGTKMFPEMVRSKVLDGLIRI